MIQAAVTAAQRRPSVAPDMLPGSGSGGGARDRPLRGVPTLMAGGWLERHRPSPASGPAHRHPRHRWTRWKHWKRWKHVLELEAAACAWRASRCSLSIPRASRRLLGLLAVTRPRPPPSVLPVQMSWTRRRVPFFPCEISFCRQQPTYQGCARAAAPGGRSCPGRRSPSASCAHRRAAARTGVAPPPRPTRAAAGSRGSRRGRASTRRTTSGLRGNKGKMRASLFAVAAGFEGVAALGGSAVRFPVPRGGHHRGHHAHKGARQSQCGRAVYTGNDAATSRFTLGFAFTSRGLIE